MPIKDREERMEYMHRHIKHNTAQAWEQRAIGK